MLSQRQLFLKYVAQTSDFPLMLEIEKAEGVYLYGENGQKYLDLISGIGVSNLGHRHPKVISAIKEQLDKYTHLMVYGEFIQTPQVALAQALIETLPDPLSHCYFVNSGSEAIEGALKLAKRYTGKHEIISCRNAYHGSSHGALSISGNEQFKRGYRPLLPGIKHIAHGSEEDLRQINHNTAAVVIEIVQGEAGVRTSSAAYFEQLQATCKKYGALLIIDEIQTGYGRTGKFWAFQHYPLIPDILVSAKGMGGGMPIGAFISSSKIMEVLRNDPVLGHITTFGGHPVSAVASLATLQVILEENLINGVEQKAARFKSKLKHPQIKEIRHKGLMMAVTFESFSMLKKIIDKAIQKGILTDWFLYCDNSMRIAPPLIISEKEIDEACQVILACIDEI